MLAVALIVTRDMEQHGLAASLKKVFPEVEFSVQKVDSFTSAKVTWPELTEPASSETAGNLRRKTDSRVPRGSMSGFGSS